MTGKWEEEIINELQYDDYILFINKYNAGVSAEAYWLANGGYKYTKELYYSVNKDTIFQRYMDSFYAVVS